MSNSTNPYSHADASAASIAQLRAVVSNVDEISQVHCDGIRALAGAALDCLDFDVAKLDRAPALLCLIECQALDLGALITGAAERVGLGHTDEEREVLLAIWQDKQRALDAALSASAMGETQS